jgi:hypothetical protein
MKFKSEARIYRKIRGSANERIDLVVKAVTH